MFPDLVRDDAGSPPADAVLPADDSRAVVPVNSTGLSRRPVPSADAERVRQILLGTNRYALHVWWRDGNFDARTGRYITFASTGEDAIRPAAAMAIGLSVSLATGAYDADRVGLAESEARARVLRLVASLAASHRTSAGAGGWGAGWQTSLWASYTALPAWLLWEHLDADDREHVRRMVEFEADRHIGVAPPMHRSRAGTVLSPGDTKAEENSWNARILQVALAMMPRHPRRSAWRLAELRLLASAYARPSDLTRRTLLHGRPLCQWLGGSNVDENGLLVNHDRIHPDYMVVPHHASALLHYGLAGQAAPRAALHNLDLMYRALVDVRFASPPYAAPGGTAYIPDSAEIYYPQGSDWGTRRRIHFLLQDVHARAFGFDAGASYTPPAPTGIFRDVPTSHPHAAAIERLCRDGVVRGCRADAYCPEDPLDRAQIATVLIRAARGGDASVPAPVGFFTDVAPTDVHAGAIEQLYRDGVTRGCTQ